MKKIEERIQQLERQIHEKKINEQKELLLTEMKKIGIEKLPYSYSSLKSFIDAETMDIHYNKHYKGYVDKLNDALSKKKYGDLELEKIIKNISRYDKSIRNNAGGAFNHALFWNMLTPEPQKLKGELYNKIAKEFGTFGRFKKNFETVAKARFGSGWVWLVLTAKNQLKIMSTSNQDNPLMNVVEGGGFPLLGLDLWEHAYYLKYKNKRDEYISNFWKVVNWDFVTKLFEMKTKTKLIESKLPIIITEMAGKFYVQSCESEEQKFFQQLMKDQAINIVYGQGITNALKTVPWLEFRPKDLSINRMQGFYKDGERHLLSYLAGNYRAFCMIIKSVNALLKQNNKEPILLRGKTKLEQIQGIEKLVNIIKNNSQKIFDEESDFYKSIISNLGASITKGEKIETLTKQRLVAEFGRENIRINSNFGSFTDSVGEDGEVQIDGITFTFQIKPFTTNFIEEEDMVVLTTARLSLYPQDLLIFTNDAETLIFLNFKTKLGIDAYRFPPNHLIYSIR